MNFILKPYTVSWMNIIQRLSHYIFKRVWCIINRIYIHLKWWKKSTVLNC